MSIQRLCSGRSASRSAGCEVMKIHPWRFFDHSRAVHLVLASVFFGSNRKLSATRLNEPRTPERWCGADGSISEASSVFFTRRSISSGCDIHCTNCCGEGSSRSKFRVIVAGCDLEFLKRIDIWIDHGDAQARTVVFGTIEQKSVVRKLLPVSRATS
jgi:hypothetical protein